jgi:hypothetical protein
MFELSPERIQSEDKKNKTSVNSIPQIELDAAIAQLDLPESFSELDLIHLKNFLKKTYKKADYWFIKPHTLRILAKSFNTLAKIWKKPLDQMGSISFFQKILDE